MPFCPECRTEYRQSYSQCRDCGVALIAELPEAGEPEPDVHLVKLTEFLTTAEAHMLKGLLEENEIQAMVQGETDPLGVISGAQPVTVLVAESDLDRALEIYDAFFGEASEDGDDVIQEEE